MTHTERLKAAIINGDVQTVRESLGRRHVSDTFKDGRTLLHVASQNGKVEIVELLLQNGSRVGARDVNGYTALHLAAAQGHQEIIRLLLEFEAQVDDQDQFGNTSVHMAAWNGFSQSIKLLVQFHANINIQNKVGFTALHTAAQRGHNQSARELLYADARVDAKNKYGETPLHTSTRHGHAGVSQILINANSNLNSKNKEGESSLHVASNLQRTKIARLLVEAGAKKSQKNKKGETALDVACKNNSHDIVVLLQDATVVEGKRKKGLFSFLRRKATTSSHSRERVLTLDPSLPSSGGSSKNLDQNQDRGLSRAGSFGDVRQERASQEFNSLDRPSSRRHRRERDVRPTCRPPPSWNDPASRYPPENLPEPPDYLNFEPRSGRPMGWHDFWHPSPGIVGAHGYPNAVLYPQAYGFVPGYESAVGGFPYPAGMLPQYPGNATNRPSPSHGGLTNTIEQSMQYYRDLAGNLKQGPASTNPAVPAPSAQNRDRIRFHPGGRNFLFDVDTDRFLPGAPDFPAHHHLYEPIGTRGLEESDEDDDLWRGRRDVGKHRGSPGQHRSPPFAGHQRNVKVNAIPLEPKVLIRESLQEYRDEMLGTRRYYYPNHDPSDRSLRPDEASIRRPSEPNRRADGSRPDPAGRHLPFPTRPPGRSHSEETLSSVMGSSHERRRRVEQRFGSRFDLEDVRLRLRSFRSNAVGGGGETSAEMRNFQNELDRHLLRLRNSRGNRDPTSGAAATRDLPRGNVGNRRSSIPGEGYISESSGPIEAEGKTSPDPDRSLTSSDDDDDDDGTKEELPPLEDLVASVPSNFDLEELEASPRRRHSNENLDPSEMLGAGDGASPQSSIEVRRSDDQMEYSRQGLCTLDSSAASLCNARVSLPGPNSTTESPRIDPGLQALSNTPRRARAKRSSEAPSGRSEDGPFEANRVTSV